MTNRLLFASVLVTMIAAPGCSLLWPDPSAGSDSDAASLRQFDAFPLYWVGKRFEGWDLTHVDLDGPFASLIYGDCTPSDGDQPSCTPPFEIQVSPLCQHLDVVARAPIWKRRHIRGAPVGTSDSAPVLFTSGAQVKVYRGEGSDPRLPWRVLNALQSANRVGPVFGPGDPIPAPPPGVLAGTRPCGQQ